MPIFTRVRTLFPFIVLASLGLCLPAHANQGIKVLGENSSRCAGFPGKGIYCWGANYLGGAGVKPNGKPVYKATRVLGSENYRDFHFSEYFGCFSDHQGEYRCWGRNDTLALGRPHDERSDYLAQPLNNLPANFRIKQLSLGGYHGCALSEKAQVACWGTESVTLSKKDHWQAKIVDIPFAKISNVVQLAAAAQGHCALHQNGQVSCWGKSWQDQLGRPEEAAGVNEAAVLAPAIIPNLRAVEKIASQGFSFCALHQDGKVSCWGWNLRGVLNGKAKKYTTHTPQRVPLDIPATDLYSALEGFCVTPKSFLSNAVPICWGLNLPDLKRKKDGYKVAARPQLANVTPSPSASCWVNQGVVECWGYNSFGQLGNGGTKDAKSAQTVKGLPSTPMRSQAKNDAEYKVQFLQNGAQVFINYRGHVALKAKPFTIEFTFPYTESEVGIYAGFSAGSSMFEDAKRGKPLHELAAFPDDAFSTFAEYNDGNADAYFVDNGPPIGRHYWGDDRDQFLRFDTPCKKSNGNWVCTRHIKQTLEKCETPPEGGKSVCIYHPMESYRGKSVSAVFSDTWREPGFPERANVQAFLLSFE